MVQSQTWWFSTQQNIYASGCGPKQKNKAVVPVLVAGVGGVDADAVVGILYGCDVEGCGAAG